MGVEICEMKPDDFPQVIELWKSCEGIGLSPDDSQDGISYYPARNPGLSFVAEECMQVLGAVLVGQDGRRGYLNHLAVKIFVFSDNQSALAFWEKVG